MRPDAELLERARQALLEEAGERGWEGQLSSSALSTATAAFALRLCARTGAGGDPAQLGSLAERGLEWIACHQNADGGWGDTTDSPSNASTTLLCWAALGPDPDAPALRAAESRATEWLARSAGEATPERLATAILRAYGRDRTFSIPILTMCALSGRFGDGRAAWQRVQAIPFELAAVPHRWLDRVGLPMVSYALPALIAVGQVRHHHRPTRNPLLRALRNGLRARTLELLGRIQPASGGYLEAAPLTSFVVMSLLGCGQAGHPVVERGVAFLASTVREDGSWPIDTNLATWLTSLAVQSLAAGGRLEERLPAERRAALLSELLGRQLRHEHPYTHAAPGGWAWTDLSGGVPDADDTAGALLAVSALAPESERTALAREHAAPGVRWLLDLQNRDGGVPTFCRGWTRLPFDASSPDITAHALRAWAAWAPVLDAGLRDRLRRSADAAIRYLVRAQRDDGAWVPLWFGNQHTESFENPLYGTARVALAAGIPAGHPALQRDWTAALERAREWLIAAQNADGGWGGGGEPSSVEETALALEALAGTASPATGRGVAWLETATERGQRFPASPIGLYFARLWYSERLYPLLFTIAALERLGSAPDDPGAVRRGAALEEATA